MSERETEQRPHPGQSAASRDRQWKRALARKRAMEHAFPNGTVSVKLHKTKRLTLVVAREELDAALIERIEALEHENRLLRRKVTELSSRDPSTIDVPERMKEGS